MAVGVAVAAVHPTRAQSSGRVVVVVEVEHEPNGFTTLLIYPRPNLSRLARRVLLAQLVHRAQMAA